jgi:hypothetical protein
MSTYDQLPGQMQLRWRAGDSFSSLLDFDIALTGYTASAIVSSTVTGATVATFTTTIPDATNGKINIAFSSAQTSTLGVGTYGWCLTWVAPGGVTRTALEGFVDATI